MCKNHLIFIYILIKMKINSFRFDFIEIMLKKLFNSIQGYFNE